MQINISPRAKIYALSLCIFVLFAALSMDGLAQQNIARSLSPGIPLPDAPVPQQDTSTKNQMTGTASVSGTVVDSVGAVIPGAQVSLVLSDGRHLQAQKSGANGQFTFTEVPAGSYFVTVDAFGFAPFKTQEFTITVEQVYMLPDIPLVIAGLNTSIVVRPTEEIAAEQIKAEEKQRMLGVFPNFYVSYVPDPAPLTSKQKFSMAVHDTFDWTSWIGISMGAGIEQATNAFSGYGQGAAGYGKRWGALFADGRSSDFLSHYVFASLLHQDPRYFYQGTGTRKSRLYHALSNAFVARSDSGKIMPNYSYLLGDLCSASLSNAYYPDKDRGANLVFTNAAFGIAGRAFQAVFQEFLGKRMTKNVPNSSSDSSSPTSVTPKSPGTGATTGH